MRLDSESVRGLAKAAQTVYEWSKEVTRPATPLMMSSNVSSDTLCYRKRSHHTEIHRLYNYNFDPTRHLNNLNQSCAQWCGVAANCKTRVQNQAAGMISAAYLV